MDFGFHQRQNKKQKNKKQKTKTHAKKTLKTKAQSAVTVEYNDCISAEG